MVGEITSYGAVVGYDAAKRPAGPESAPAAGGGSAVAGLPGRNDETVALSSPNVGKAAERLAELDVSNRTAQAVRAADAAMAQVGDSVAKIKQALTQIVKQYPPYGQESRERLEYLSSIAGLRKQIEAVAPFLSFAGDGQQAVSFPGEDKALDLADFGLGQLDIPELGPKASDAEVAAALVKVEAVEVRVGTNRAALAEAVQSVTAAPLPALGGFRIPAF